MQTEKRVGVFVAAVVVAVLAIGACGSPSCFNHQTKTYRSVFGIQEWAALPSQVTPFVSPGQSERVIAELVLSAKKRIDIAVASWASFEPCGAWNAEGCTPAEVRNAAVSPFFVALVNAIHAGVDVRLLVGYCSGAVNAPGTIDQFSFLALTGATVRAYATTDFVHSKYVAVDGVRVAIMSANIDLAAFRYNREAGVVYEDPTGGANGLSPLLNFTTAVFDADWAASIPYPVDAAWPQATLDLIRDPTPIPLPPVVYFNSSTCSYNVPDPPPTVTADMDVVAFTLPDARVQTSLLSYIAAAKTSIDVYIYVIDSQLIASALIAAAKANPHLAVRVLVSSYVVPGPFPYFPEVYKNLTAAGIPVHVTNDCLGVHHIKTWIIDSARVFVSTNNWAESEFPIYSVFPPGVHGADRGLVFSFNHPDIIAWYASVMDHDWLRSIPWTPALVPPPPPPPTTPAPPSPETPEATGT